MTGTPVGNDELGFTAQAMLCDSAAAVDGKLYIQGGGWNAIAAGVMPFAAPRIGMALLIGVPYGDTERRHQLTVGLADEDGSQLPLGPVTDTGRASHLQLGFEVGRPAKLPPGDTQLLPFALNIDGYAFARPGGYAFVIAVDQQEITRLRFRIHLRS
ncbi:MAG: hypothetical protein H0V64_03560 [Geodermatophilaceae bacterium]|nr:hypothetical protein [Geodermatophilaceae bacterium]MDQ3464691.1 hypothetical protein [Actinomycetota bacterium]